MDIFFNDFQFLFDTNFGKFLFYLMGAVPSWLSSYVILTVCTIFVGLFIKYLRG